MQGTHNVEIGLHSIFNLSIYDYILFFKNNSYFGYFRK